MLRKKLGSSCFASTCAATLSIQPDWAVRNCTKIGTDTVYIEIVIGASLGLESLERPGVYRPARAAQALTRPQIGELRHPGIRPAHHDHVRDPQGGLVGRRRTTGRAGPGARADPSRLSGPAAASWPGRRIAGCGLPATTI